MQELTQEEITTFKARSYADPVYFAKNFLPQHFPGDIPPVHIGLLAVLINEASWIQIYYPEVVDWVIRNYAYPIRPGDPESPMKSLFFFDEDGILRLERKSFLGIMLPRGFSKTTIAGLLVPLRDILFEDNPLGLYISETGPHAKMQLENIKRELTQNDMVTAFFGHLKPKIRDDEKWTGDLFETKTGMAMVCRGRGGQIRGTKHRQYRPKKIICDDLEDKESVRTNDQRMKVRDWFYSDVIPALPSVKEQGQRTGQIIVLGTLLHDEALLNTLSRDPKWSFVRFGAEDRDGNLLWSENMNRADLEETKQSFALSGLLSSFYMEYFNIAVAPETQKFKREYFIYSPVPEEKSVRTAVYMDPAISRKDTANDTVIAVVGMAEDGMIYVLEMIGGKAWNEREKVDRFFYLHKHFQCALAGVENTAYQGSLEHLMREEMFRKHIYFELEGVPHTGAQNKKYDRIVSILQPRYASGFVRHVKRFPVLETQLMELRQDVETPDDWPDALAGAVALLDPLAPQAAAPGVDLGKDMYEPLEEWRWA